MRHPAAAPVVLVHFFQRTARDQPESPAPPEEPAPASIALDAPEEGPVPVITAPPVTEPIVDAVAAAFNERLARAIEMLRMQNHALAEEARSDALEIGFQVARRILEKEISTDVTAVMALVKSALKRAQDARVLAVHVCPEDHAMLTAAMEQESFSDVAVADVTLVQDSTLGRGDVRVLTDFGSVDGTLATRLGEMRQTLRAHLTQEKS